MNETIQESGNFYQCLKLNAHIIMIHHLSSTSMYMQDCPLKQPLIPLPPQPATKTSTNQDVFASHWPFANWW